MPEFLPDIAKQMAALRKDLRGLTRRVQRGEAQIVVPTLDASWSQLVGYNAPLAIVVDDLVTLVGTLTGPNANVAAGSTIMSDLPLPATGIMFFPFIRQSGAVTAADVRISTAGVMTTTGALTTATWFPLQGLSYYTKQ